MPLAGHSQLKGNETPDSQESLRMDAMSSNQSESKLSEQVLQEAYRELEQRVLQRTAELAQANEALQAEIAGRKQLEEQLQRAKDEFISMASHELKTPVTSIKGYTQLLSYRFQNGEDEESADILRRMDSQLNKLTQLIRDLLDVSKMQWGQLDYREEPFDLGTLVQEIVERVRTTTETHQLILDDVVPTRVLGDRDRVRQVVTNLLANAIRYSPKADRVIVRVTTDAETAVVSVQDFGIGIAESQRERIFEQFYQISEQNQQPFAGLGLGLYICNEVIKHHHGRMWVESKRGEGSTLGFTLPLHSICVRHVSLKPEAGDSTTKTHQ